MATKNQNPSVSVRQGDVALSKVNELPKNAKLRTKETPDYNVIAYGEHSNHMHAVSEGCEVYELENDLYINVTVNGSTIRHLNKVSKQWTGEHVEVPLEVGVYKFTQQNQFDPYKQAVEKMRD